MVSGSRRVWLLAFVLTLVTALGVAAVAVLVPGRVVDGTALPPPKPRWPNPAQGPPPALAPDGISQVITAQDGKTQVIVPYNWSPLPAGERQDRFQIQYGHVHDEQYVVVLTHRKDGYRDFDAYVASLVAESEMLPDFALNATIDISLGGMPGVRRDFTGTLRGVEQAYWHVAVDGRKAYYEVVGWTLRKRATSGEDALLRVIGSFRETITGVPDS